MNGVVLVDKPRGVTSFDVVRLLRHWCQTRQVGHCGTLDPLASGLLPVALGSATRLVEYLMADDKEYLATLALGTTTDTQDATGLVIAQRPWDGIERADFVSACQSLSGAIQQLPPMFSALKRDGVPLYRLARQGVTVERQPRAITVYAIEILEFAPPLATIRVVCSKGTYIRTLCHDLGEQLGCGAHLTALRRLRCGAMAVTASQQLEELRTLAAAGQPLPFLTPAAALAHWPAVRVREAAWGRLAHGRAPCLSEVDDVSALATGTLVRLLAGEQLAATASFTPGGAGAAAADFVLHKVFPAVVPLP